MTFGWAQVHIGLDMVGGLASLWLALHEWVGLVAYRWLGRSNALFPAPAPAPAAGSGG